MTFDEILEQVVTLLERQGRVSYRALKRRFDIDDDYIADLKEHTVVRNGSKIAFYEHGSGDTTVVFAHPIAYGLATFQPIVEQLCQEFRLITIDPRGTGASDPLAEQFVQSGMDASTGLLLNFITPNPEDDVVDVLPHIQVPTLVMHGTDDRYIPFEMGRYLVDHLANAQFYPLEGRGHGYNAIRTATNEFCQVLRCFIQTGRAPKTSDATP